MNIHHIFEELEKHDPGTFLDLESLNGYQIGAVSISGRAPVWEMHPDTDELFVVLEGELEITLREAEGPVVHHASAGSLFVVPKGIWHKPAAPDGVRILYYTPGTTLHSESEDPLLETL